MATSYFPLEPDFTSSLGLEKLSFSAGQAGSLSASLGLLFTLGIMVVIVTGAGALVYAGWQRIQPSQKAVTESNKTAKRAVLGTFGVVCLYVLLRTFNADLVSVNIGLEKLRGDGVGTTLPVQGTTGSSTSPAAKTNISASYQARVTSHNQVLARLAPSGIHTNHGDKPCTEAQFNESRPECTSLAFLPEETIQLLLRLNGSCRCTITITGGTEPGHTTHGEGKRSVDLRIGGERGSSNNPDPLYQYIKNISGSKLGPNKNCYERYIYSTFTFCDEKPPNPQHFHVG